MRIRIGCFAALVPVMMAMVGQVQADPTSFAFGTVQNYNYDDLGGFCLAASFINGATYLQNAYPSGYGNTPLSTGPASTSAAAALDFAYNGWTSPQGTAFSGYYTRVGQNGATFGDWWQTAIDWTESYAPGKTAYSGQVAGVLDGENPSTWTRGSNVADQSPTYSFLRSAATKDDFVELAVYGYNIVNGNELDVIGGHAIDLADITCSHGTYTLTYQDPNFPTSQFLSAKLSTINIDGEQFFTYDDPYTFGANAFIAAAVVESALPDPVPEPSSLVLLVIGTISFVAWRRRR
jgi:hypothetical protein